MIRLDDKEKETELTGIQFAYYESEYLMTADGKVYRKVMDGYKPASIVFASGALRLAVTSNGRRKLVNLAKLVKRLIDSEQRDRKWTIKHKDGDAMNCHPDNLEWVRFKGRNHGRK